MRIRHNPLYRWITDGEARRYIRRFGGHMSEWTAPYPWRLLYNSERNFVAYVVKK